MPLQRCTQNGKSGWRWGKSGKCYTGPGAKKKAIKQKVAIEHNGGASVSTETRRDMLLRQIAEALREKSEK